MKKEKKIIRYSDELNDDFAGTNINKSTVDESFKYIRSGTVWKICSFIVYYIVAVPLVWFFERVILGVRFVNRKAVKQCKSKPYFLYGNHTGWYDAFTPNLISVPRRNRIVVGADTVSIKGLRHVVQMLGAIPIPSTVRGMKKFSDAIDYHHRSCNITVFPEAHIWPYYTGVRPFGDVSFGYAVKYNCPVFAFFTAYTAPRGIFSVFRKANMTVYVSDPIFPNEDLPYRDARRYLRDKVYAFMLEKSKLSNYKVYEYVAETEAKVEKF